MKKSISLLLVAGMLSLVACGPSEKEKAAEAARIQDSLAKDSMDRAQQAAEAAAAEALKMQQDSLAKAAQDSVMKAMQDSIAALSKKVSAPPKTTKPKLVDPGKKDQKPEEVKPGTGRG